MTFIDSEYEDYSSDYDDWEYDIYTDLPTEDIYFDEIDVNNYSYLNDYD